MSATHFLFPHQPNPLLTPVYANSVLAVLNSRRSLMDKGIHSLDTGSFGMKADERDAGRRPPSYRISRSPFPARVSALPLKQTLSRLLST